MAETYYVNELCVSGGIDSPFLAIANAATDANESLEVLDFTIVPYGANYPGINYGVRERAVLISALTGGTPLAFSALRSDSTSLPSGVKLVVMPDSITEVANGTLRYGSALAAIDNNNDAINYVWHQVTGRGVGGDAAGWVLGGINGATQNIVLGEGRGIACGLSNKGMNSALLNSQLWMVECEIVVGGNTYRAVGMYPQESTAHENFALINESGSGVTVEVKRITTTPATRYDMSNGFGGGAIGTSFAFRTGCSFPHQMVRISKTMNGAPVGGVAASVLSARTSAEAPSSLVARKGDIFSPLRSVFDPSGLDKLYDWPNIGTTTQRDDKWKIGTYGRRLPTGVRTTGFQATAKSWVTGCNALRRPVGSAFVPITLKPGEGLAFIPFGVLQYARFEVSATIRRIPASATFPAVGDVDNGVQYGPTGTDYTGTLVQPAEADVESGVSYGAGGTEFTGTYVGGGGGNTYSRGRVVNS